MSIATEFSLLPEVAREAIRAHLEKRRPAPPAVADGALSLAAPVFVTLKLDGELRGCMGTLAPEHDDLVAETMARAVVAATQDPRFPAVTAAELERCTIEVTVLGPLEPVASADDLDPHRYGVEVSDASGRRAVMLPNVEGIETVAAQLALTRQKAGIAPDVPVRLRRFETTRVTAGPSD